jgi:hypothetical protein
MVCAGTLLPYIHGETRTSVSPRLDLGFILMTKQIQSYQHTFRKQTLFSKTGFLYFQVGKALWFCFIHTNTCQTKMFIPVRQGA